MLCFSGLVAAWSPVCGWSWGAALPGLTGQHLSVALMQLGGALHHGTPRCLVLLFGGVLYCCMCHVCRPLQNCAEYVGLLSWQKGALYGTAKQLSSLHTFFMSMHAPDAWYKQSPCRVGYGRQAVDTRCLPFSARTTCAQVVVALGMAGCLFVLPPTARWCWLVSGVGL